MEWASFGLHTIFAQRRNLLRPSFYLMIADVLRFNRKAPEVRLDAFATCTTLQHHNLTAAQTHQAGGAVSAGAEQRQVQGRDAGAVPEARVVLARVLLQIPAAHVRGHLERAHGVRAGLPCAGAPPVRKP
jgi:hypothetical protein